MRHITDTHAHAQPPFTANQKEFCPLTNTKCKYVKYQIILNIIWNKKRFSVLLCMRKVHNNKRKVIVLAKMTMNMPSKACNKGDLSCNYDSASRLALFCMINGSRFDVCPFVTLLRNMAPAVHVCRDVLRSIEIREWLCRCWIRTLLQFISCENVAPRTCRLKKYKFQT